MTFFSSVFFPPIWQESFPMRYAPSRRNMGNLRLKSLEALMNAGTVCDGGILLTLQLNVAVLAVFIFAPRSPIHIPLA